MFMRMALAGLACLAFAGAAQAEEEARDDDATGPGTPAVLKGA